MAKRLQKNLFFYTMRRWDEVKQSRLPKCIFRISSNSMYQMSVSYNYFLGVLRERNEVQDVEIPKKYVQYS